MKLQKKTTLLQCSIISAYFKISHDTVFKAIYHQPQTKAFHLDLVIYAKREYIDSVK